MRTEGLTLHYRAVGKGGGNRSAFPRDSPVKVAPMTDAEDEDKQSLILQVADNPVVADAVSPEVAQPRTFKGLADAARII